MIIRNIFINFLIVFTSENSMKRKRTCDNAQNVVSSEMQNFDLMEDQPLDLSAKRNKIEENQTPGSRNTSYVMTDCLKDKNIKLQLSDTLRKLLVDTLNILDLIFFIYEKKCLDVKKCLELELEELKMQVDTAMKYLHKSKHIKTYRNSSTESSFVRYIQSCKHKSMVNEGFVRKSYEKLVRELERTSIRKLIYTLLFVVKESGSNAPKGVITCALLILAVNKIGSIFLYRDFLIYLIVAHKKIVFVNSQTDSDSKVTEIQKIKCSIYKKMCEILFTDAKFAKYDEVISLTEKYKKKNLWFNEPSVILLMQYINNKHMTELDYILKNLNEFNVLENVKINESTSKYYCYMFLLFQCETILLKKASLIIFST
uniref:Uncharacterized protein n=1 Tax=Nosema pernyi TaxID=1112939 RepID=X5E6A5_9MICR|nr:hypothetical protein NP_01E09 [Nosema pernyi]